MCEKVTILHLPTKTIGRGFSEHQLLLVALQCGKQTEIAKLLSCDPPKSHHTITSRSQTTWAGFHPVILILCSWTHRNCSCFLEIFESISFPYLHVFSAKLNFHHSLNLSILFSEIIVPLQNFKSLLLLLTEWSYISDTCLFLNLKTKPLFRDGWHMRFSGCHSEQEHLVRDETASLPAEDAGPKHVLYSNWKHM